ncbi:hypothetical protein L1887_35585 [Cichorium endivia]|nr:hypothetical protein L1887_35585 [Cichorium endivia]
MIMVRSSKQKVIENETEEFYKEAIEACNVISNLRLLDPNCSLDQALTTPNATIPVVNLALTAPNAIIPDVNSALKASENVVISPIPMKSVEAERIEEEVPRAFRESELEKTLT